MLFHIQEPQGQQNINFGSEEVMHNSEIKLILNAYYRGVEVCTLRDISAYCEKV